MVYPIYKIQFGRKKESVTKLGIVVAILLIGVICLCVYETKSKNMPAQGMENTPESNAGRTGTPLSNEEKYIDSYYVREALQFIKFYELLPQKGNLIATPDFFGVKVFGDDFGVTFQTYLTHKDIGLNWLLEQVKDHIGGEEGVKLFRELSLQVKLKDEDPDFPVIYMYLCALNAQEQEKHIKAIQKEYKSRYHKELKIYQLSSY